MSNSHDSDFDPLLEPVAENGGVGIGLTIFIVFLLSLSVYLHATWSWRRYRRQNHETVIISVHVEEPVLTTLHHLDALKGDPTPSGHRMPNYSNSRSYHQRLFGMEYVTAEGNGGFGG
ncbi:hypothetical protein B0J15DRAFT_550763 [Fusarium solani]|uniref:Uncharacterized protein n=1 Tax=Fusarium solani TaxID=169388 RepID=A0A9P9K9R2_FUSSL|nr:uncharacterized protein B0J15DRAFT_550763 [Fusarium solani]KAH7249315.1 hypothetical protein B0J15DRAFT_550763 [Fusarium solani]